MDVEDSTPMSIEQDLLNLRRSSGAAIVMTYRGDW